MVGPSARPVSLSRPTVHVRAGPSSARVTAFTPREATISTARSRALPTPPRSACRSSRRLRRTTSLSVAGRTYRVSSTRGRPFFHTPAGMRWRCAVRARTAVARRVSRALPGRRGRRQFGSCRYQPAAARTTTGPRRPRHRRQANDARRTAGCAIAKITPRRALFN